MVEEAAAEETEAQMDLLEPLTAEEKAVAQDQLGPNAQPLAVLKQARENRKGRPPGSRNRRTDDFVSYVSQFGPDPAVAMMKIIGEDEDAMIARSRQIDPIKKRLSFAEARAMRIRCAETMMPYFHGKKPVEVDATVRGVMIVEEISQARDVVNHTIDGIVGVAIDQAEDDER
ncbi:MAG: hypothetical protein B7Y88_13820 [Sphingomonadales bacterium 32-64-17]|nr:MAG: hypothetical protein B7Y88_13820 [Sphingomonadales bacterium 32-64-17]